jgi:hypothetical protein
MMLGPGNAAPIGVANALGIDLDRFIPTEEFNPKSFSWKPLT